MVGYHYSNRTDTGTYPNITYIGTATLPFSVYGDGTTISFSVPNREPPAKELPIKEEAKLRK
jgi:hypothetical protein